MMMMMMVIMWLLLLLLVVVPRIVIMVGVIDHSINRRCAHVGEAETQSQISRHRMPQTARASDRADAVAAIHSCSCRWRRGGCRAAADVIRRGWRCGIVGAADATVFIAIAVAVTAIVRAVAFGAKQIFGIG